MTTVFLFWWTLFWKKIRLHWEKKSFFIKNMYSEGTVLIQNFKSYIFSFLTLFDFKSFGGVLWPLTFFFTWIKISFACQWTLAEFNFAKPWPLQQPPEAKLLISACSLRGQKFRFECQFLYELQFSRLSWDLTNFYSK